MKTIGLIVAMLFSVTSWGATPAKVPAIECGGKTYTDLSNLKWLRNYTNLTNAFNPFTLRNTSAAYAVAGTTLTPLCMRIAWNTASNSGLNFYKATANHNKDLGTEPAGTTYHGISTATWYACDVATPTGNSGTQFKEFLLDESFTVANGEYMGVRVCGVGNHHIDLLVREI